METSINVLSRTETGIAEESGLTSWNKACSAACALCKCYQLVDREQKASGQPRVAVVFWKA